MIYPTTLSLPPPPPTIPLNLGLLAPSIPSTPAILASDPPPVTGKIWFDLLCIAQLYSNSYRYRYPSLTCLLQKGVILYYRLIAMVVSLRYVGPPGGEIPPDSS